MALDVALLREAVAGEIPPTLRFYTWSPPAVSLGAFQAADGIDRGYLRSRGWDLVRRPTGGRAVLHQHELTYSLVLPPAVVGGAGVRTSYRVLTAALNAGLRSVLDWRLRIADFAIEGLGTRDSGLGTRDSTPNCFALASECDTLVPEGKLVGSAQVRKEGALLQHGSILLDAEPDAWNALFGTAGRLVTLRQLLRGEIPDEETVAEAVCRGFQGIGIPLETAGW
jgi:lipoyl(octanoyl) transferase